MRINFDNVRLRNKMLLLYFLSVLIPIVLTNVIFYNVTTNNVKKQKLRDISLVMEQIRNDFRGQVDLAVGISAVILNDSLLNQALNETYTDSALYVENYHSYILYVLNKYSPVYKAIQDITIYSDNDTILFGGRVLEISDEAREEPWYKQVSEFGSSGPVVQSEGVSSRISVVRRMNGLGGQTGYENILKIDLHPDMINQIFSNATLEGSIYLLEHDSLRYTTDDDIGRTLQSVDFSTLSVPKGTIVLDERYANEGYLSGWRIAGLFQEKQVLEEVRNSREFILYLSALNIVIPTLIIVWFTRSLNRRLVRILKHMKKVKNRFFETIKQPESKDEIGQLTAEFNRMTLQIKSLIQDVYQADIQKKELELKRNQAQLHALQSQINPHFLFNSLETIRMRSLMKEEKETARIIHNMAKMFRRSLSWGNDHVTVRDELDLVVCFLEIQQYRFGGKLNYRIDVDPEAEQALIPKMTLQPLVENASIHGIEPMKDKGDIHVSVRLCDGMLVCKVKDNGAGMTVERLCRLLRELEHSDGIGERIGIKNVFYRLKLYYGGDADFRIRSAQGHGTDIEIRMPYSFQSKS